MQELADWAGKNPPYWEYDEDWWVFGCKNEWTGQAKTHYMGDMMRIGGCLDARMSGLGR